MLEICKRSYLLLLILAGVFFVFFVPNLQSTDANFVYNPPSALLEGCGDICRLDIASTADKYFNRTVKHVQCEPLMRNAAIDTAMRQLHPPRVIPLELLNDYTYNGHITVVYDPRLFFNQRYLGGAALQSVWTAELINGWVSQCANRTLPGTYGIHPTNMMADAFQHARLKGADVLVIGSEKPWLEACLLAFGAAKITTLEYGSIQSTHPKVTTITPSSLRSNAHLFMGRFDVVATYSSLEHSGLGRYGDAMNPWGDRQAAARAWCMTKAGGHFIAGLPSGTDTLFYNAHRQYGPIQLPHIFANWKQVWQSPLGGDQQQVWVLQK